MKKETLFEIILGTVGGLVFAFGMCMCLIPEWNLFQAGIIVSIIGSILLLCIIPLYRKTHSKKKHTPISWDVVLGWIIGIIGVLILGFGMSRVMVGDPSTTDMIWGISIGIAGLIICVLDYPIFIYIKSNQKDLNKN